MLRNIGAVIVGMLVGGLTLAGGLANAVMLSLPAWTWIEMPFYLVVAWWAGRMVQRSREAAPA